jgi:hypothetical protein
MTITSLILSGNLLEAKRAITARLNENALALLDEMKKAYASQLFEEFDANKFKDKTELDSVKDAKAAGADVGEDVPDKDEDEESEEPDEDNEGGESDDDEDNKKSTSIKGKGGENITVNIKEEQNGGNDGAPASSKWKKYTKSLNKKMPAKAKVDSVVSESQGLVTSKPSGVPTAGSKPGKDQPGGGANENPSWKKKQKSLMAMKKALGKTDAVVSEEVEDVQEVSSKLLGKYIKRSSDNGMHNSWLAGDADASSGPRSKHDKIGKALFKDINKKARERTRNRRNGIDMAVDKLTGKANVPAKD